MTESKIQLVERWRGEGREKEAARYRDEVREQLRAQGKTRKEAREGAWEAARAAFPPLPPAENLPEVAPAVRAREPAGEEGFLNDETRWVMTWFNCVSDIADWQADHGVRLTDAALRALLALLGETHSWAWMIGARSAVPKSYADRACPDRLEWIARGMILLGKNFRKWAEVLTVENLAGLRSTEPPPSGR